MPSETPAHDFLLPRLNQLMQAAHDQGIARDVAVAVLTDLLTGPDFNTAAPAPTDDSAPLPQPEQPRGDNPAMIGQKLNLIDQIVEPRTII